MIPDRLAESNRSNRSFCCWKHRIRVLLLVVLLLVSSAGLTTAPSDVDPSITIQLQSDGSAEWTIVNTVSLSTEGERAAFEELAANDTRKQQLLANTIASYREVANGSSERLDRSMSVEPTAIDLRREGATGVITARMHWTNFARTTEAGLVVGDVFAGGFPLRQNRTLTIQGPEGYRLASHNVSTANSVADGKLTWEGPATIHPSIALTYEKVTPTPTPTPAASPAETGTETSVGTATETSVGTATETSVGTATGESAPGFGIVVAVVALLAATLLGRRRD